MSSAAPDRRPFASLVLALLPVMLLAIGVRVLYQMILPSYAYSYDISAHEDFASTIGSGENPYATTPFFLAWPPFWGFCIYALARVAEWSSAEFIQVLRVFLIAIDMIVMVVAASLVSGVASVDQVRKIILFGIALNPIVVLLTVQHGNFDSIVVTWIMCALLALRAWRRSRDPVDWLLACLFLGMGIFTKTVPFALAPLLIPGVRAMTGKARFIGASLLLGPAAVGLGSFYILDPAPIIERVILYRSSPGRFGVSGVLKGLELTRLGAIAGTVSTVLLVALLIWGCVKAWSWADARDHELALLAGLIMLAIPTLGPGFAPQYAYWFVPLLAVTYPAGSRRWRIALLCTYAITAITYVILYGFAWDLGQPIFFLWDSPISRWLGAALRHDAPRTWLTLPMFVSWVGLLVAGALELRRASPVPECSAA